MLEQVYEIAARIMDCKVEELPDYLVRRLCALDSLIEKGSGHHLVSSQLVALICSQYMVADFSDEFNPKYVSPKWKSK